MSEPLKIALLGALRRLLVPLARLMLQNGIGVGDVQHLVKIAFVQAARDKGGDSGTPSASRIAMLTGLRRADIKPLLAESETAVPEPERNRHRGERVLAAWWTDPEFQDEHGRPAILPLRGERSSFAALVRRYSGEPRVLTLRDELLRVKAIRQLPSGELEALSRTFATTRWDPDGVALLGEEIRDHLITLSHNLERPQRPIYARTVQSAAIDPRYVPLLLRDLTAHAETLADSADDALNAARATVHAGESPQAATRLGVTIYFVEEPSVVPAKAGTHKDHPPAKAGTPKDTPPAKPSSRKPPAARRAPRRRAVK